MTQLPKNEAPVVDVVGVYHSESNVPSDVFVRRAGLGESEFDAVVETARIEGIAFMRSIAEANGRSGVPDNQLCHLEKLNSQTREGLLGALGAKALKSVTPAALLYQIGSNDELGIRIHEVSGQEIR